MKESEENNKMMKRNTHTHERACCQLAYRMDRRILSSSIDDVDAIMKKSYERFNVKALRICGL
jgi:hypothetical protein